jgi:hypothetical protein
MNLARLLVFAIAPLVSFANPAPAKMNWPPPPKPVPGILGDVYFLNNSPIPWAVTMYGAGATCGDGFQADCTIAPHEWIYLHYSILPGLIEVKSQIYHKIFNTAGFYIYHSGGTGNIVVNDPEIGVIRTCGSTWPCEGRCLDHNAAGAARAACLNLYSRRL